jgi:hypothetical protein
MFDPKADAGVIAWTVRGGDKLSTKQFQIYVEKGVNIRRRATRSSWDRSSRTSPRRSRSNGP